MPLVATIIFIVLFIVLFILLCYAMRNHVAICDLVCCVFDGVVEGINDVDFSGTDSDDYSRRF